MARVTGPLMSIDASGTVAGAIVFSKWRGRNYVRRHAVPANPRLPAQLAARSIIAFLAKAWKSLSDVIKATWEEAADAKKVSPFNEYVAVNARNWRDLMPPSQSSPAERVLPGTTITDWGMDVSGRQVALHGTLDSITDQWGVVVCRSATGTDDPLPTNAVAVVPVVTDALAYVDGPLSPGVYYYAAFAISTDGLAGVATTWVMATVT